MKANTFIHKITKEQLQALPLTQFAGEVIVVDKEEKVAEAVAYLSAFGVLGVDTETKPAFQSGQRHLPALIQIATLERCYLFRLNKIGLPEGVANILADNNIIKVGLAFRDDLNGLRKHRRFVQKNCIDLQKIVLNYGILDLGLQKIFAIVFGQKISKAQRLTNWENEVLTPEQARYAATDAWATLSIYLELRATEPITQKEAQALRQAEIQRLIAHQQQVLAERAAPSNSSRKREKPKQNSKKKTKNDI